MDAGNDREELLRRVDLGALIEELCAPRGLRRKGNDWPCPNPEHAQSNITPPVSIGLDRNGGGYEVWSCHGAGCGHGGTALDALVSAGRARSIGEAFGLLRGDGSLRFRWSPDRPRRSREVPAPSAAARDAARTAMLRYVDDCHRRLMGAEGAGARAWLRERGFTIEELERNRVGFDPGLIRMFREKGTLPRPLHGGVTLPLSDEHGETVYVQARQLTLPTPRSPKYLNPGEGWLGPSPRVSMIHSPSDVDRSVLVVTEGMFDGILTARHFETWAKVGSKVADATVADRLVKAAAGRLIVVIGDRDKGGREGAEHLAALLRERAPGGVAWTTPPTGDVNDLRNATPDQFGATLRVLVAEAAEQARDPRGGDRTAELLRERAQVDTELDGLMRASESFERQRGQWRAAFEEARARLADESQEVRMAAADTMRRIGRQLSRSFPHQAELETVTARAHALDHALRGGTTARLTSAAFFPGDPVEAPRWNGIDQPAGETLTRPSTSRLATTPPAVDNGR